MTIRPLLVKDRDTGKLCIQISLGSYIATLPLPDEMATWKVSEIQAWMEKMAPEMIRGLKFHRAEEMRKLRRKT